jgi:hypothetical protein
VVYDQRVPEEADTNAPAGGDSGAAQQTAQTGGEGQAPSAAEGQEPGSAATGQGPSQTAPASSSEGQASSGDDTAKVESELARARAEAAAYRRRAKDAEDKLSEQERAKLSEQERTQRERDEARQQAVAEREAKQKLALEVEVLKQAGQLGFKDPSLAEAAIRAEVEFDDEGKPSNVKALLGNLAKRAPYLIGATSSAAAPDGKGNVPAETDAQKYARLLGGGGAGLWPDAEAAAKVWPPASVPSE